MKFAWIVSAAILVLVLGSGCTSVPVEQRDDRRAELEELAEQTLAEVLAAEPEAAQELENAPGYFVSRISAANVALLGGGQGTGILRDLESGERTFLNVKRFDVGAGLGVRYYRVLVIVHTREKLEQMKRGITFRALAADLAAGSSGTASLKGPDQQISAYVLSDTGGLIAATARLVRLSVNRDLTDTGLSEISVPNRGFNIADNREQNERRWWDHKMPFMAQKVIDMGYDLPLPYGFKLAYANVDQDQILENLYIGFNGSEKEYLPWVSFDNATSHSDSAQLIYDTWIFPFMNVFAMLGTVEGVAPLDVVIEGNGMLGQLGIDCSKPGNLVVCKALEDKLITLSLSPNFQGDTYGLGFNLAGGWRNFFVTIPVSWTYADMQGSDTDGAVLNVTPRGGYVFNMGRAGNLAVYAGGAYLDSDLTAAGSVTIPGTDFDIDYQIDQSNTDKWNGVLGANWDINNRWAIQAEYNGFFGSRESWIGSVTWRF